MSATEAANILEEYKLIINSLIKDCIGLDFICDELSGSDWCEEHCNNSSPDIECVRKYYAEKNVEESAANLKLEKDEF